MRFCKLILIVLGIMGLLIFSASHQDDTAVHLKLGKDDGENLVYLDFILLYDDLYKWETVVQDFATLNDVNESALYQHVLSFMTKLHYDLDVSVTSTEPKISSHHAVQKLTYHGLSDYLLFTRYHNHNDNNDRLRSSTGSGSSSRDVSYMTYSNILSSLFSPITSTITTSHTPRILIYQTSTGPTGGTYALQKLYHIIQLLSYYDVILCDLLIPSEKIPSVCYTPSVYDIVITGEWCHALQETFFRNQSSIHGQGRRESGQSIHGQGQESGQSFHGRGIQYHLGFHHMNDVCSGFVTVTDSHYLMTSLQSRTLGGYYWGAPMTDSITTTSNRLLRQTDLMPAPQYTNSIEVSIPSFIHESTITTTTTTTTTTDSTTSTSAVYKNNIIIIDPDLSQDYPPSYNWTLLFTENELLELPSDMRIVFAKDIPHTVMPLLLQRAKIVIDLAMPGPERLTSEGIMLGAIPIVSSRWNGASPIDFTHGIHKIDHQNVTAIKEFIKHILLHYEDEFQSPYNQQFYQYIHSLSDKLYHTMDVTLASSMFHFILVANTLHEESMIIFQVLSILYLYPLSSITIIVPDVLWFIRNHYSFYSLLVSAGYIHTDIFDPTIYMKKSKTSTNTTHDQEYSYVKIISTTIVYQAMMDTLQDITEKRNTTTTTTTMKKTKKSSITAINSHEVEKEEEEDGDGDDSKSSDFDKECSHNSKPKQNTLSDINLYSLLFLPTSKVIILLPNGYVPSSSNTLLNSLLHMKRRRLQLYIQEWNQCQEETINCDNSSEDTIQKKSPIILLSTLDRNYDNLKTNCDLFYILLDHLFPNRDTPILDIDVTKLIDQLYMTCNTTMTEGVSVTSRSSSYYTKSLDSNSHCKERKISSSNKDIKRDANDDLHVHIHVDEEFVEKENMTFKTHPGIPHDEAETCSVDDKSVFNCEEENDALYIHMCSFLYIQHYIHEHKESCLSQLNDNITVYLTTPLYVQTVTGTLPWKQMLTYMTQLNIDICPFN